MSKEYECLDDYTIGEKFISPARTITETDNILFAGLTGDWHPLQTDPAPSLPFTGWSLWALQVLLRLGIRFTAKWKLRISPTRALTGGSDDAKQDLESERRIARHIRHQGSLR
jgi:hypothetical protein